MTPLEATTLCRLAKAACPQQAFDEYTPDAWFEILQELRFEDAKAALFKVAGDQPFVAPAEIKAAVKRIRWQRITDFGLLPEPPMNYSDDPRAYMDWTRELTARVADGELKTRAQYDAEIGRELTKRDLPALEGVFPHVD